jgi:hypothetical protein
MNELPSNPRLIIITGGYFADRRPAAARRLADDAGLAGRLWDQSAVMCGV